VGNIVSGVRKLAPVGPPENTYRRPRGSTPYGSGEVVESTAGLDVYVGPLAEPAPAFTYRRPRGTTGYADGEVVQSGLGPASISVFGAEAAPAATYRVP